MADLSTSPQSDNSLQWFEQELQETRSRLQRTERELDQATKRLWALESDLRKMNEIFQSLGAASGAVTGLKEDLRQLRDQISKVQDRQASVTNQAEEISRQTQAEVARDRQERVGLGKQIEGLARAAGHYENRMQALEETWRRTEERLASLSLAQQGTAHSIEDLASRSSRNLESLARFEQQLTSVSGQMDGLYKQVEALSDRSNLLHEHLRRYEERVNRLESLLDFPQETREMMQRAAAEREQLAQRIAAVERLGADLIERDKGLAEGLSRVDQKGQLHGPQLLVMAEQLQDLNRQTTAQIKKLQQVILRQRRRQADSLAQEIKELSQGEANYGE